MGARNKALVRGPLGPSLAEGDRVIYRGAGREWTATVTSRRMSGGRVSVHPIYDDTAVFVTIDETGVSIAVPVNQVSRASEH